MITQKDVEALKHNYKVIRTFEAGSGKSISPMISDTEALELAINHKMALLEAEAMDIVPNEEYVSQLVADQKQRLLNAESGTLEAQIAEYAVGLGYSIEEYSELCRDRFIEAIKISAVNRPDGTETMNANAYKAQYDVEMVSFH